MKKSKFTESQIIGYLRRMEQGEKTADLCREAGVSQGTMYQWKSKYSGMEVSLSYQLFVASFLVFLFPMIVG